MISEKDVEMALQLLEYTGTENDDYVGLEEETVTIEIRRMRASARAIAANTVAQYLTVRIELQQLRTGEPQRERLQ
ncbi:MAG: hypothetical protein NVSMB31_01400 [Vulcanimicrobiaceae bacterium]